MPNSSLTSSSRPVILTFPKATIAEANQYSSSLADEVRDVHPDVVVERRRDRVDTQDFGATLALILVPGAVTAVAKGIAAWLARHSGAAIEISRDGKVVATNLDSKDAARIAEALSRREAVPKARSPQKRRRRDDRRN